VFVYIVFVCLSVCLCGLKYLLHVTELYTSQGDVSFTLDILRELTSESYICLLIKIPVLTSQSDSMQTSLRKGIRFFIASSHKGQDHSSIVYRA